MLFYNKKLVHQTDEGKFNKWIIFKKYVVLAIATYFGFHSAYIQYFIFIFSRWFKNSTNPNSNEEDWLYTGGYWDRNYEDLEISLF